MNGGTASWIIQKGSITAPKGFMATGVACGLKKNGQPDLALVISERNATAAGVFTTNRVKGHSLVRTMDKLSSGTARGVIINSGNANACVGDEGLADADAMAAAVADAIGCQPDAILTGSTGVIGKRLNMTAVMAGVQSASRSLGSDEQSGHLAESAIMTTDLIPKEGVVRFPINGVTVTLAGMAKGSGMIHPNMATMISIMTTDATISQPLLQQLLREATGTRPSTGSVSTVIPVSATWSSCWPTAAQRHRRSSRKRLRPDCSAKRWSAWAPTSPA